MKCNICKREPKIFELWCKILLKNKAVETVCPVCYSWACYHLRELTKGK